MIILLLLSFLVSIGVGFLLLRLFWPRTATSCPWPLGMALAVVLGTGVSSVFLFAWMLAFGPTRGVVLAEIGLLGLLAVAVPWRQAQPTSARSPGHQATSGFPSWLVPVALLVLAIAASAFASTLAQHPHGDWDAWMNWNLKARMFFRGGDAWRAAFSADIPWSHPDYPVMVPSLVARSWLYAGRETLLGPGLIAATFTFGTLALLAGGLTALRGVGQALLASIVLLSTPLFIIQGTWLYADVPVGLFFLSTFVCLTLDSRHGDVTRRFAVLAGIAAGFSMWTKNEGLLFTLAVAAAILLDGRAAGWANARRRLVAFGAGVLPLLLLTAGYKVAFAPPNDLISTLGIDHTIGNLTSLRRYDVTLRGYVEHLSWFGSNGVGSATWLLVAYLLGGGDPSAVDRRWVRVGAAVLLLVLLGHFMVFVSMAHELSRLLASSLDRLLVQLWPSALFLFFLVARVPGRGPLAGLVLAPSGRATGPGVGTP